MLIIIGVIILLILLLVGVGYFYGSRHFVVREETIEFQDLPDEFDGYRICQFSDFHAMAFHRGHEEDVQKVVDLINAQHCDMIVCLSHLGFGPDDVTPDRPMCDTLLAREVQDIDLIIGGHSHQENDTLIGRVRVISNLNQGRTVGKLTMNRKTEN